MKKPTSALHSKRKRNEPLESQILKDRVVHTKKKSNVPSRDEEEQSDGHDEVELLDSKQTTRILREARKQQLELQDEIQSDSHSHEDQEEEQNVTSQSDHESSESEEAAFVEEEAEEEEQELPELELEKMSAYDRQLFEKWSQPGHGDATRSLSEMILAKLNESAAMSNSLQSQASHDTHNPPLNPKVVQVYQKLGVLLQRYKSGKLPKAFKVLPALKNWEQVLLLTQPAEWSPHAVYQATRLFSSSLKPWQAQRFYTAVLLPHVRESIQGKEGEESRRHRLNAHLYAALRKSIYKPSAFFKGILLPLAESGDCTLKEAAILSSVLSKTSIPVLHAAAALLKLAEMEYSGANSLFIRALLDKKFTLPYRVIDELVLHFCRFEKETRELTVLWHQSLLVFCQRYKQELTSEQKRLILKLTHVKAHPFISAEIARELQSANVSNRESATLMSDRDGA